MAINEQNEVIVPPSGGFLEIGNEADLAALTGFH